MQSFILFIICLLIFLLSFSNSHMMQKTRDGHKLEKFETINTKYLPSILTDYLRSNSIPYSLYKIPNYVSDLLKYHKNFSTVYLENQQKYVIILFVPSDKMSADYAAFKPFYDKISQKLKEFSKDYTIISIEYELKADYVYSYDKIAYADLKKYCEKFCLIDPKTNMMFVFKRISNSETEALDVLFQQYNFMKR